jgi:hypothetical protein
MESKQQSKLVNGIKITLTAVAVTGSIALWSDLSYKSIQANSPTSTAQSTNASAAASNISSSSLRVVNMAVPQGSSVSKPQVQSIVINNGNSGSAAPFTNSRTS